MRLRNRFERDGDGGAIIPKPDWQLCLGKCRKKEIFFFLIKQLPTIDMGGMLIVVTTSRTMLSNKPESLEQESVVECYKVY